MLIEEFRTLKEVGIKPADIREFEEWAFDKHYVRLSDVQRAWVKAVLGGAESLYFLAFTGFGKTTTIRLLAEYLADKGHSILIVTQAGPARQLDEKLREDYVKGAFSNLSNIEVLSYQQISAMINAALKGKRNELLSEQFDYVFLDDVEGVLDDMRNVSLWKLWVLRQSVPTLRKPVVVRLPEVSRYFAKWGGLLEKWTEELLSAMLIDLEPDEMVPPERLRELIVATIENKRFRAPERLKQLLRSWPVAVVAEGPSLEELFSALDQMSKEEFKERAKAIVRETLRLAREVSEAYRVLYGLEEGFRSVALKFLDAVRFSDWHPTLRAKLIVSSASFSNSSRLWGFLVGLTGAVGGRKIQYFGAQVKPDLVKLFVEKREIRTPQDAVRAVLDVWESIDFKSNVLVFIDTGLFDEKEVKRIVELGNEELKRRGLEHSFVRVSSSIKSGLYERGSYKACNVEWLVENARVAGGEGPYLAIVGSSAPNSPIVRGLDLPGKAPVAVFIGTPSVVTRVEVPSSKEELVRYLVIQILKFTNVEKIVRTMAEEARASAREAESAVRAVKKLLVMTLKAKDENPELAKAVAKGEADALELVGEEALEVVEPICRIVEKLREMGVERIEKHAPNVTVFMQALGRTARALGVENGKVKYHPGIAVVFEWREELLGFLEKIA